MPDEGSKKHGGESRPEGTNGKIEVRPRNWLVPVTLLTLRECASYGYKLMEQTAKFGFEAMNPGTYYRTLRNMEKDGLCKSEWDTTNGTGPARRVYSITGRRRSLSGLLGRGFGAVPAQHGRLLQPLHGKQATSTRRPPGRRRVERATPGLDDGVRCYT
jgi:poly-beta-hydroxybutyrate-responsive repressor